MRQFDWLYVRRDGTIVAQQGGVSYATFRERQEKVVAERKNIETFFPGAVSPIGETCTTIESMLVTLTLESDPVCFAFFEENIFRGALFWPILTTVTEQNVSPPLFHPPTTFSRIRP